MRQHIEFSLTEGFRRFMFGLADLGPAQALVHGIFIDLHPIWKQMVDFRRTLGIEWPPFAMRMPFTFAGSGSYDSQDLPTLWKELCLHNDKEPTPFIVKIYVLPREIETLPLHRIIENYANRQPFFAVVLDQPMPVLASKIEGGTDLTAVAPGTLGGFLKDQNGKHWGVTCGHVAQTTGGRVDLVDTAGYPVSNGAIVGPTNFGKLSPQNNSVACNQYVNPGYMAVDAALIELKTGNTALSSVKSVGQIDKVYDRNQLGSGSTLRMMGAMSGAHDYDIGGYGVTAKVRLSSGNTQFCFSHLFEFYAPSSAPAGVPGRIACAMAPRPLQGDSGAWLCFNYSGSSYAYFGNLIAVRGTTGISTFADALLTWADNEHGLKLQPL